MVKKIKISISEVHVLIHSSIKISILITIKTFFLYYLVGGLLLIVDASCCHCYLQLLLEERKRQLECEGGGSSKPYYSLLVSARVGSEGIGTILPLLVAMASAGCCW